MVNILVIMVGALSIKMFIDLNQKLNSKEAVLTKKMNFLYMTISLFIYAYITLFIPIYFFEPLNIPSEYKAYIILGYWIVSNILILNLSAKKKEIE